jgi:uncharacterized protein YciI
LSQVEIDKSQIRYVLRHLPGPAWRKDLDVFHQPGVAEHLGYLRGLEASGEIAMSGPFLAEGQGGMVILRLGLSEEQARDLGERDPAVRSGLIVVEINPWLVTVDSITRAALAR